MKFIDKKNADGSISVEIVPETDQEKQQMREHAEFWEKHGCNCGADPRKVRYVDDYTPGALVTKHHWVCTECNGIQQIG